MSNETTYVLEGPGPYGFRIKGGTDHNTLMIICNVLKGGKAEKAGILGDHYIISINDNETKNLSHTEAVSLIKNATKGIKIVLRRKSCESNGELSLKNKSYGNNRISADFNKKCFKDNGHFSYDDGTSQSNSNSSFNINKGKGWYKKLFNDYMDKTNKRKDPINPSDKNSLEKSFASFMKKSKDKANDQASVQTSFEYQPERNSNGVSISNNLSDDGNLKYDYREIEDRSFKNRDEVSTDSSSKRENNFPLKSNTFDIRSFWSKPKNSSSSFKRQKHYSSDEFVNKSTDSEFSESYFINNLHNHSKNFISLNSFNEDDSNSFMNGTSNQAVKGDEIGIKNGSRSLLENKSFDTHAYSDPKKNNAKILHFKGISVEEIKKKCEKNNLINNSSFQPIKHLQWDMIKRWEKISENGSKTENDGRNTIFQPETVIYTSLNHMNLRNDSAIMECEESPNFISDTPEYRKISKFEQSIKNLPQSKGEKNSFSIGNSKSRKTEEKRDKSFKETFDLNSFHKTRENVLREILEHSKGSIKSGFSKDAKSSLYKQKQAITEISNDKNITINNGVSHLDDKTDEFNEEHKIKKMFSDLISKNANKRISSDTKQNIIKRRDIKCSNFVEIDPFSQNGLFKDTNGINKYNTFDSSDPIDVVDNRNEGRNKNKDKKGKMKSVSIDMVKDKMDDKKKKQKSEKSVENNQDEKDIIFPFKAMVLYNFKKESHRELDLQKGETVEVVRQIDSNWYEARVEDKIGIVPKVYVNRLINKKSTPLVCMGVAVASYDPKSVVELQYQKGDKMFITTAIDDNWYEAIINNDIGIVLRKNIQVETNLHDHYFNNEENENTEKEDIEIENLLQKCRPLSSKYNNRFRCLTMYTYKPRLSDEIEIKKHETLIIYKMFTDGWCYGYNEITREIGMFPSNFVEILN